MLKKLSVYLKGYGKTAVLSIIMTVCEILCELVIPLLMAAIVDVGIPSGDLGYMAKIGAAMVGIAVLAIFFGVANSKFASDVSQGFAFAIRGELFNRTQDFSFANIDQFSGASLITRMTNDITSLQTTLMMSMRILIRSPIMLVSSLIVAAGINLRLSGIIIGAVILLTLATVLLARAVGGLFSAIQRRLDDLNRTVQENLIAIRTVKAFVREAHERVKFKNVNDAFMNAGIKAGRYIALMMPIMMLVLNATTLSVIWTGGRFIGRQLMTTGQLMSFISYIMQILISVIMFSMGFIMLTRARASAERVLEVIAARPDVNDEMADSTLKISRGKIEFQKVGFRYATGEDGGEDNSGENVLSDISFTADPGEFIGIIGGTGSGKTSLVSLIPRFYDVTEGVVLVDGTDVRGYTQKSLRDGIGMVMQQNNLFSGTIRENLMWGDESASEEDIVAAAKAARAHEFIKSFPEGYDTVLGQGGVNLSGGQKQRICIARALLKKPPILILDDSTSAVDVATEAQIRQALRKSYRNCTVIVVAQRISSVKDADRIIVLESGAVSGTGTHEQLLEANEIYREICISQNVIEEGGAA